MPASPPTNQSLPRQGAGQLQADWCDKVSVARRSRRAALQVPWIRRLLLSLIAAAGLAGAASLWWLSRWHDELRTAAETNHRQVAAILASDEFAAFARDLDRQLFAVLNFAAVRPAAAGATLPTVATWEQTHRERLWALQISVAPVSYAAHPDYIFTHGRDVAALLARHGFAWDESTLRAGRALLLRLLSPYTRQFVARHPEVQLAGLGVEQKLQDEVLTAYCTRSGSTTPRADANRLLAFYALVGPAMWKRLHAPPAVPTTAPPRAPVSQIDGAGERVILVLLGFSLVASLPGLRPTRLRATSWSVAASAAGRIA